jgi:hypothetical protein
VAPSDASPSAEPTIYTVAELFRFQALGCEQLGSPFYRDLCLHFAHDAESGGPTANAFAPNSGDGAYPLRMLGGIHRLVLNGDAPELAPFYPSVGGNGDAAAAWPAVFARRHDPAVIAALARPPQTNETGRAVGLFAGLTQIAAEVGVELHLREIGASAGLNLRLDRFAYDHPGGIAGDPASALRFPDQWQGDALPPFGAKPMIASRIGCDKDPIDALGDGAEWLRAYVWPDSAQRRANLDAAIEIARDVPAEIVRADAAEWLAAETATRPSAGAFVVMHSTMWQYLTDETRAAITATMHAAGSTATKEAPVAWLRYEPFPFGTPRPEVRLTRWPGGVDRVLAHGSYHLGPVEWLDPERQPDADAPGA